MSSVGINNGMCRCCASEGTFKDVKTPYNWMGVEEIYYDMLQECFDIHLTSVEDSDNGGICEVCITQLRNAANFKKQVLHTEEQFKLRLEGKFFKGDEVKIEAMDKESDAMDFGRDSDDNTSDNDRMETEVLFAEGYEELPIKSESEDVKPKKRTTRASTSKAKKSKSSDGESSTKHEDKRCQICNRAFTKMFNLNRHIRTKHDTERVATMKKLCDGCGKVFINSEYLAKHLAIGCLSKTKLCVKCDKHFDRKSDMYKHMRAKHWCGSKLSKFHCPLCEEVLKCHEEHDKHLSSEHDVNLEYQEMEFLNYEDLIEWKENIEKNDGVCFPKRSSRLGYYYHCYPTKYLSSSRFRGKPYICPARIEFIEQGQRILASYQSTHLCERENSRKIEKARVFCPLCEVKLDSYEELNGHLLEHNIEVGVENFSFTSFEDFHEWKSKMEKETIQFFTRSSTIHTNKSRTEGIKAVRRSYYFCTAFKNKPKANKTCPARFTLTIEGTDGARKRKKQRSDVSATPERVEHRINVTSILQNSNASPFRDKTMRGFSCLYCAKDFPNIEDLRTHTALQSEKDKLNSMLDYKLSYNPIKVDITNLKCTLCDTPMNELNDLKEHLIEIHNKTIYKDIKDIILPFRLENGQNFTCVICSVVHISFKNLYHHMSSHYRNYCCNKCGAGYITIAALRKHDKTHIQGNYPCDYCNKVFISLTKKRNHEKGVHTGGWLRNKCPHCPEIFVSYYDRSEHLAKVHNEAPLLFPCNACDKTYKKKFELNRHIKHHHLQQKSYICEKCNAKFFSKRGLLDHLSKHLGVEMFECHICGKKYSREVTLKNHIKMHTDSKSFECQFCKKIFSQKHSLKYHMRLHQNDLEIFKEFDDVKHLIDDREITLAQLAAENKKKERAEKMKQQSERNEITEQKFEFVG